MMSSNTLKPSSGHPHTCSTMVLATITQGLRCSSNCLKVISESFLTFHTDSKLEIIKPFDQTIILQDHEQMCQSEVIQDSNKDGSL